MADWKPPTQDRVEGYFKELNNWGRWGNDDQRGTANLITPAKRAQAAGPRAHRPHRLARARPRPPAGPHVPRDVPLAARAGRRGARPLRPRLPRLHDHPHRRALPRRAGTASCSTGGRSRTASPRPARRGARSTRYFDGITTRGVLLDVAAGRKEGYVTVGQPGDAARSSTRSPRAPASRSSRATCVVVRNGDEAFRKAHPDWVPRVSPHPGLHLSCLEWFREKDIAAISWDMMDERPIAYPGFAMSTHLAIPFLGLVLVDNTVPRAAGQRPAPRRAATSSSSRRRRSG